MGCLLVFFLLEVALRITGLFYPILDPERGVLQQVTRCQDCRRILCVGDSFTYESAPPNAWTSRSSWNGCCGSRT